MEAVQISPADQYEKLIRSRMVIGWQSHCHSTDSIDRHNPASLQFPYGTVSA
jgi:hypothetical protein